MLRGDPVLRGDPALRSDPVLRSDTVLRMKLRRTGRHVDPRDDGNAILETVGLGVVLLLPCIYGVLAIFTVQSGVFGATEAARQAGRALESTTDPGQGVTRAQVAAELAVKDQGLPTDADHLHLYYVTSVGATNPRCDRAAGSDVPPTLTPGNRAAVRAVLCVEEDVPMPYTDSSLLRHVAPVIPVTGSYTLSVDDDASAG